MTHLTRALHDSQEGKKVARAPKVFLGNRERALTRAPRRLAPPNSQRREQGRLRARLNEKLQQPKHKQKRARQC